MPLLAYVIDSVGQTVLGAGLLQLEILQRSCIQKFKTSLSQFRGMVHSNEAPLKR